jgi:hypothetical protein
MTTDNELDSILTAFLAFTLGNRAIQATPEFARKQAKLALTRLIEAEKEKTLKECQDIVKSLEYSIPDPIRDKYFVYAYNEAIKDALYQLSHPKEEKEDK